MGRKQHCRCRKGTLPRTFTRQGQTLYKRLNLDKENCTQKDIKSSYNKLSKKYHPDAHDEDEEKNVKFREISEAYDILTDEKKKEIYDKYGSLGIHVGEIVGYQKVEKYLTKKSAGYKFTTVMLFLLTGCCFCCCCYFCFCFCCGLCLPKRDKKTLKASKDKKVEQQNPYVRKSLKPKKSQETHTTITQQPKSSTKRSASKKPTTFVEVKEEDSSETVNSGADKDIKESRQYDDTKLGESYVPKGSKRKKRSNENSKASTKEPHQDSSVKPSEVYSRKNSDRRRSSKKVNSTTYYDRKQRNKSPSEVV